MSKGCWRRPLLVSQKEYSDNWDRIFKKKTKEKGAETLTIHYDGNLGFGEPTETLYVSQTEEKEDEKQDTNVSSDSSTDK